MDNIFSTLKGTLPKPAESDLIKLKQLEADKKQASPIKLKTTDLVKAWQKAGCGDEEIARLCDIAMCGDHGIGERYNADLILESCIAKGDDICALRYKKRK